MMFKKIETVFIPTKKIDECVKWYTEKLDVSVKWKYETAVAFKIGETDITIVEEQETLKELELRFNLLTDSISTAHYNLYQRGVIVSDIKKWKNLKYFDFQDYNGYFLQVISYN